LEQAKKYLYTSFWANSDCFILGIFLSYVFKENIVKQMITKWLYVLLVLSFLGVFCTMYEYKNENFMPAVRLVFLNPIHNLLWASIIFCLMLLHDKYLNMLFANKFMVWLSQLSYSIYIWHLPIRAYMLIVAAYLVTAETPLYFLIQFVLSWVVTLLVSVISYRFVEKPFLALK
jgi:peptidoglycan/LPS O-acetylase OafA/YrhL